MKKSEIPQDKSKLQNFTKELCYAKNNNGEYEKVLSSGWEVKSQALDAAWDEVNQRVSSAKKAVAENLKSPIFYFMELNLMDIETLSGYSGFWKFSIKRHMNPIVFKKLSKKKLEIYARVFKIKVEELMNYNGKD